jgi:succinate dehydrogenase / fumarate reductase membrane anchor subunit
MRGGTELGRVRGLGSAKGGTHHWILQRFTAVGNLLLVSWLLFSLARLPAFDHATVSGWLAQPLVAVPMILMLVSVFWHLRLGLQVLIEDYVHDDGLKFAVILLLNFFAIGGATFGLFSVAKIAFAGGAL